jgi:hypothetical protein
MAVMQVRAFADKIASNGELRKVQEALMERLDPASSIHCDRREL